MENSTFGSYLRDVQHNQRIMSNEDQVRLHKAYKAGDRQAYDVLVNSMLALVLSVVYRMIRGRKAYGAEFDDMVQAGNVAMLQAIDSWNPDNGRSLPSWAMTYIRREVAREGRRAELVKPTVGERSYYEDLGHSAGNGPEGAVEDEGDWAMLMLGEAPEPTGEQSDDTADLEHSAFLAQLWERVDKMDDLDANILKLAYLDGLPLTQVADEVGVSRQTVHTRIRKALDELTAYTA